MFLLYACVVWVGPGNKCWVLGALRSGLNSHWLKHPYRLLIYTRNKIWLCIISSPRKQSFLWYCFPSSDWILSECSVILNRFYIYVKASKMFPENWTDWTFSSPKVLTTVIVTLRWVKNHTANVNGNPKWPPMHLREVVKPCGFLLL